jgi:hypothetical protein
LKTDFAEFASTGTEGALGGCADFLLDAGTATLHAGNFVAAWGTSLFFGKFRA